MSQQKNKNLTVVSSNMTAMEISAASAINDQEVVSSDTIIPRMLIGQGTSPAVTTRKVQLGDMYRSTNNEVFGNPDKSIDVVPIMMTNTWINFQTAKSAGTTMPAFRGMEHRGITKRDQNGAALESNEGLPWEYKGINGEEMFRRKAIVLYALLPSDIVAYEAEIKKAIESGTTPDINKNIMPVVLTFQSTGFKYGGKKCASFFQDVKQTAARLADRMTIAPFQYVLTVSSKQVSKGQQTWYVFDILGKKSLVDSKATPEVQAEQIAVRAEAARWSHYLSKTTVKVDDTNGEVLEEDSSSSNVGEIAV